MSGNKRYVNNADQKRCPRCGAFTKIVARTKNTQRIKCSNHGTGTNMITLYGDERLD